MISNAIDLSSEISGTKGTLTESKIANSLQTQKSGSHISYSEHATSVIAEQDAATLSDPLPDEAINLLLSQAQPHMPETSPLQKSSGQFTPPNRYSTSFNRTDIETLSKYQHLEEHQVVSPFVTSPSFQNGTYSDLDTIKTASYEAEHTLNLQSKINETKEQRLPLYQYQESTLPLSKQPRSKHLTSQFNANISKNNSANLNLPMTSALTESHRPDVNEANIQLLVGGLRPPLPVSQWGPVPVTSTAPLAHQAQELLSPLREQIRFQIDQQIKQAELRLDPPELGKVELNIRLDGDRLHIQIHAANASVRDSLLIGLDRLRAEIAMDHGGEIDVDINQGEQKQKQEQEQSSSMFSSILPAHDEKTDTLSTTNDRSNSNQINLLA